MSKVSQDKKKKARDNGNLKQGIDLLKDSLFEIINKTPDDCFKCHVMAKLNCQSPDELSKRLDYFMGKIDLDQGPCEISSSDDEIKLADNRSSSVLTYDADEDDFNLLKSSIYMDKKVTDEDCLNAEFNYFAKESSIENENFESQLKYDKLESLIGFRDSDEDFKLIGNILPNNNNLVDNFQCDFKLLQGFK